MTNSISQVPEGQRHDRIAANTERSMAQRADDASPNAEPDITITQKMLSAVSGSIFTSLLVTPLDVVRVRLQSQQPTNPSSTPNTSAVRSTATAAMARFNNLPPNLGVTACCREVFWVTNNAPFCVAGSETSYSSSSGAAASCAAEESQRRSYTSTLDGLRKIARNEGLSTLWRGLSPTLAMAVPGNVIYFAGYDWLRTSTFSPMHARVSDTYAPLLAGSSARVLAALFVSPIELVRTRMQASHSASAAENFYETLKGVKDMTNAQGYRTLWRGLTLTLWRDVPFSALYWWGYEATRNALIDARCRVGSAEASLMRQAADSRKLQNHSATFVDSFVAGAVSGAAASVVTTPFDVGKTRQQVFAQAGDAPRVGEIAGAQLRPEDRSMPRMLWHIFKDEGMAGLLRGWGPRCAKVAPACAIMISSYEMGKRMAVDLKKDEV